MWQVKTLKQYSKVTAGLNENTSNNHFTIENQDIDYRNERSCFHRANLINSFPKITYKMILIFRMHELTKGDTKSIGYCTYRI